MCRILASISDSMVAVLRRRLFCLKAFDLRCWARSPLGFKFANAHGILGRDRRKQTFRQIRRAQNFPPMIMQFNRVDFKAAPCFFNQLEQINAIVRVRVQFGNQSKFILLSLDSDNVLEEVIDKKCLVVKACLCLRFFRVWSFCALSENPLCGQFVCFMN